MDWMGNPNRGMDVKLEMDVLKMNLSSLICRGLGLGLNTD